MAPNKKNTPKKAPKASSIKELEKKKKQVFKPILDNPYTQSNTWPFIEPEISSSILDFLEVLLSPIGKYKQASAQVKQQVSQPDICKFIYHGFNSTVKALENQARINRGNQKEEIIQVSHLFICKYDIVPNILTSMFPVLSYTASRNTESRVKLVQLPRGSTERLSKALGEDNIGIIAFKEGYIEAKGLFELVNSNVKDVEIPWLEGLLNSDSDMKFIRPALRNIITTAPVYQKKKQDQKQKQKQEKGEDIV